MTPQDSQPTFVEFIEGVTGAADAAAVLGPIFPGLLLCVPGLAFFGAFALIPLVAVALLGLVVAVVAGALVLPVVLTIRLVSALSRMVARRRLAPQLVPVERASSSSF